VRAVHEPLSAPQRLEEIMKRTRKSDTADAKVGACPLSPGTWGHGGSPEPSRPCPEPPLPLTALLSLQKKEDKQVVNGKAAKQEDVPGAWPLPPACCTPGQRGVCGAATLSCCPQPCSCPGPRLSGGSADVPRRREACGANAEGGRTPRDGDTQQRGDAGGAEGPGGRGAAAKVSAGVAGGAGGRRGPG